MTPIQRAKIKAILKDDELRDDTQCQVIDTLKKENVYLLSEVDRKCKNINGLRAEMSFTRLQDKDKRLNQYRLDTDRLNTKVRDLEARLLTKDECITSIARQSATYMKERDEHWAAILKIRDLLK